AYRPVAMATLATHDTSSLLGWWHHEAGTVDTGLFERACRQAGVDFNAVAPQLFDLERTRHGRLWWRAHMTADLFRSVIGKSDREAWNAWDLMRSSLREREQFLRMIQCPPGTDLASPNMFMKKALGRVNASACIFASLLFQDWLAVDTFFDFDPWESRINFPGTTDPQNWTLRIPLPLEDIVEMPANAVIRAITETHRRLVG
ncbi:MAG: 4-alpha-glucanotransferase, partial [Deltaproteobacteria bacterium]